MLLFRAPSSIPRQSRSEVLPRGSSRRRPQPTGFSFPQRSPFGNNGGKLARNTDWFVRGGLWCGAAARLDSTDIVLKIRSLSPVVEVVRDSCCASFAAWLLPVPLVALSSGKYYANIIGGL